MTRRTLIVGGGFIGRATAQRLAARGSAVRILTSSLATPIGDPSVEVVSGDAGEPDLVQAALAGCTTVVWCAGRLLPTSSPADLAEIDDLTPLVVTLRAALAAGAERFVHLSSGGTVYGDVEHLPIPESTPLRPMSIYGAVRVRGERWVEHHATRGLPATILRCGNLYGPGQGSTRPQGVVAHAFAASRAGRPLELRSSPATLRDYVHVDDVVSVIVECLDRTDAPAVMNVGTGVGTTLAELVEHVRAITGSLDVVSAGEQAGNVHANVLDVTRLRSFLPDFEPVGLAAGLRSTYDRSPSLTGER